MRYSLSVDQGNGKQTKEGNDRSKIKSGGLSSDYQRLRDVNRNMKRKWIDIITMKTGLFDVEAQMIEINRTTLRTEFGPRVKSSPPLTQLEKHMEKNFMGMIPDSTIESEEQKYMDKEKNNKHRLPKEAKKIMKDWLLNNISNPYPK